MKQYDFELLVHRRTNLPYTSNNYRPRYWWTIAAVISGFGFQYAEHKGCMKYVIFRNTSEYDLPPIKQADWIWHNRIADWRMPWLLGAIALTQGYIWERAIVRYDSSLLRILNRLSQNKWRGGVVAGCQMLFRMYRTLFFCTLGYNYVTIVAF